MPTCRTLSLCMLFVALAVGCGDDPVLKASGTRDPGTVTLPPFSYDASVYVSPPGICDLGLCPTPFVGIACCTPLAQCGFDLVGSGASCIANAGEPRPDKECRLDECPEPEVGLACCTPTGDCGADPFATGAVCFANAQPVDAGAAADCDVRECPYPAIGFRCCAVDGRCGTDPYGFGQCAPNLELPPAPDAGKLPPIVIEPPDDASITGECPSFLGITGPVWGCCAEYDDIGICGTYQFGECLIPAGAPIPVADEDGGIAGCRLPE